jgi:hypothetical protein
LRLALRLLPALAVLVAGSAQAQQSIGIVVAPTVQFPSFPDSNSPGHWLNGSLVLFNSMFMPYRSEGADQYSLGNTLQAAIDSGLSSVWIEATWMDDDGTLFAWYHHEPPDICPNDLTAPRIGALVSHDNGITFQDLGFVLESGDPVDCTSQNGYFAGGNGDFSVVLDNTRTYFYFLYSNYGGDVSTQGVAVARMAFQDRFNPARTVWKYYSGGFTEPGLGGRVTPTFPANVSWTSANADAFWGPSVHWNTALNQYVMLLNRSCCSPGWPQEGIYLSTNPDISDPTGWIQPMKVLNAGAWYPQVLGEGPGETDKIAGAASRLYIGGVSCCEMIVGDEATAITDAGSDAETRPLIIRIPVSKPARGGGGPSESGGVR